MATEAGGRTPCRNGKQTLICAAELGSIQVAGVVVVVHRVGAAEEERGGGPTFSSRLFMEKVALSASLSSGEANFIYAVSQRAEGRMEGRVERRRKRGSRVEIASFSHSVGEEGGRYGCTAAPFRIYAATRRGPFSRSARGKKWTWRAGLVRDAFSHLIDFSLPCLPFK